MNIFRIILTVIIGIVILATPMAIATFLIVSHDPINLMGNAGAFIYALSVVAGMGLVALADRLLKWS
jgi:hypothetical protein